MFVKIGSARVINLNNVVQVYEREFDGRTCIQIDFKGECRYERFYPGSAEYTVLSTWIDEQPHLLNDE